MQSTLPQKNTATNVARINTRHPTYIISSALTPPLTAAHHNSLVAAVLHDTVEDTSATIDEILATFGDNVARIVNEVTDDKSLSKLRRKHLQVEHAPKLSSHAAKLVKLADKLYNFIFSNSFGSNFTICLFMFTCILFLLWRINTPKIPLYICI